MINFLKFSAKETKLKLLLMASILKIKVGLEILVFNLNEINFCFSDQLIIAS